MTDPLPAAPILSSYLPLSKHYNDLLPEKKTGKARLNYTIENKKGVIIFVPFVGHHQSPAGTVQPEQGVSYVLGEEGKI